MTYKLQNDLKSNPCSICKTNEDGSGMSIPMDEQNSDYQTYLLWLEQGNVPTPADEGVA